MKSIQSFVIALLLAAGIAGVASTAQACPDCDPWTGTGCQL